LQDRQYGAVMLRSLEDSDVLITPSLADLADAPSDLDGFLRATLARGIAVHVLELPGHAGSTLQPVAAAIARASAPLEHARKQLQAELSQVQANAERRLEVALAEGMQQMARNWGLPAALSAGLPALGSVKEKLTNGAGGLGPAIAAERKRRGWTQAKLAEMIGCNQSSISRLEADGVGDVLDPALAILFSDQGGNAHANAT
jgi:DNA-binding XRE family transcriptional regulator